MEQLEAAEIAIVVSFLYADRDVFAYSASNRYLLSLFLEHRDCRLPIVMNRFMVQRARRLRNERLAQASAS